MPDAFFRLLLIHKMCTVLGIQPLSYTFEPYLDGNNTTMRKSTARLRCSSRHTLNIETGRYIDQSNPSIRLCDFCNKTHRQQAIEDEAHFFGLCIWTVYLYVLKITFLLANLLYLLLASLIAA